MNGKQTTGLNQSMTLNYKSLLDTVTIQVFNGREKLCECKRFIFELLGTDFMICDLMGVRIKGQIKVKGTTYIPIIVVD